MKILILGSGMYVTGRNGTGSGTILSSLAQTSKSMQIDEVIVVSKSKTSEAHVAEAVQRINKKLNSNLQVRFVLLENDFNNQLQQLNSKTKVGAAVVSLPDHLHFEFTKTLLEQKIHALVVKPLTPTLAEAKELIRLQEQNKVFGCVEFHKRYDETNLYIKRALNENTLGNILFFQVDYSQRISIPTTTFKSWAHLTNIFQYLGVHYVDLIYFLTGATPQRLTSVGTDGILKQQGIDTYDSVHTTIEWLSTSGKKFVSILNISWVDANKSSALSDQKYKVVGTEGRIECDQKNRGVELVTEKTGIQQINPYFSDYLPDENGDLKFAGYGHTSIHNFFKDVNDLMNGKVTLEHLQTHRPSFQSALPSTAIVEAVNESLLNNGEWTLVQC